MSKKLAWIYFFLEHKDAIKSFSPEALKEGLLAVLDYVETGEKPDKLSALGEAVFYLLKSGADRALEHHTTNRERGIKGMESRWHKDDKSKVKKPENKPTEPQAEPKEEPKAKKFIPPTVEEVRAYCKERNNCIDAEHFVDHYTTRGWIMNNKKKMVDWKAAVRTWERSDYSAGRRREDLSNDTSGYGHDDDLWN